MNRPAPRGGPSGRSVTLVLALLFLAAACHRKAPGPDECREFARRAVGMRGDAALEFTAVAKRVDDLTTECLVTPFDRELLACVEQGLGTRLCLRDFDVRHAASVPTPPLRPERRPREVPFP